MASGKKPKLIRNRIQNGSRTDSNSAPYSEWDAEIESGLDQQWNQNVVGIGFRIGSELELKFDQDGGQDQQRMHVRICVELEQDCAKIWSQDLASIGMEMKPRNESEMDPEGNSQLIPKRIQN